MPIPVQDTGTDLKLKKENIAQYRKSFGEKPPDPLPKAAPPQEVDKIDKTAKFGSRPGEKRIPVDQMTKPLGSFHNGTDYVPKTGNYTLEEGEAVTPKEENMADIFAHVPGRAKEKKPKKEIEHIKTRKVSGGFIHEHHHTHPEHHPMEEHASKSMDDLHAHMEDHMGTPNSGEAEAESGNPESYSGGPAPMVPAAPAALAA